MTPFAQFIVWVLGIAGATSVGIAWTRAWDRQWSGKGDDE